MGVDEPLRIEVADLKRAVELLLDHVLTVEGSALELDHDMFWSIPAPALYEVHERPSELTIGQLSESWSNVTAMMAGDSPTLSYGLVWLADVLRAAGLTLVR
jgi:hypothetical protein